MNVALPLLFAFNDKDGEPVFSIAVSLSGFVMLSANHRKADGRSLRLSA